MNEQIRVLYEQARSVRYHDGDPMREGNPPTVYWQGETSAERFAELIIEKFAYELMDLHGSSPEHIVYAAKRYGVEL